MDTSKIKNHLKENKNAYLAAAGGVAVGALGVLLLHQRPILINNVVAPSIAPVFKPVFNNTVNNGGPMRKIVRCLETGQMWLSVTEAAEATGNTLSRMSQHLNGHKEQLNGLHYIIEGLAAG